MSSNDTSGMSGMGGIGGMGSLPGANAMGDTLEFVKNLWGAMKIPGMSMPSMSPEDIDKQIADLKAVEAWLQMNMNMLRGSIQALEVQSATLSALRSMSQSFTQAAPAGQMGAPTFESPFASMVSPEVGASEGAPGISALPEAAAMAAQFANPAMWWNVVQEQFSNAIGQAMTPETGRPPRKAAAKKTVSRKSAPKKAAASKGAPKKASPRKRTATRP
jgi:hypothetical protein